MSTTNNVQEALAQAMLNKRVYRDLEFNLTRVLLPNFNEKEMEAFTSETGITPDEVIEVAMQSLTKATSAALEKIRKKYSENLKKYHEKIKKPGSEGSGPGGDVTVRG